MTKKLITWLLFDLIFVTVFVIAVFFLDDPVSRVFIGISGACGMIVSTMQIARASGGKGSR